MVLIIFLLGVAVALGLGIAAQSYRGRVGALWVAGAFVAQTFVALAIMVISETARPGILDRSNTVPAAFLMAAFVVALFGLITVASLPDRRHRRRRRRRLDRFAAPPIPRDSIRLVHPPKPAPIGKTHRPAARKPRAGK